jgi:hypothetical protein
LQAVDEQTRSNFPVRLSIPIFAPLCWAPSSAAMPILLLADLDFRLPLAA